MWASESSVCSGKSKTSLRSGSTKPDCYRRKSKVKKKSLLCCLWTSARTVTNILATRHFGTLAWKVHIMVDKERWNQLSSPSHGVLEQPFVKSHRSAIKLRTCKKKNAGPFDVPATATCLLVPRKTKKTLLLVAVLPHMADSRSVRLSRGMLVSVNREPFNPYSLLGPRADRFLGCSE